MEQTIEPKDFQLIYQSALKLVEQGQYNGASEKIREMRDAGDHDVALMRLLLSSRIAIKSDLNQFPLESLRSAHTESIWLKAETHFVLGLYYFSNSDWMSGIASFGSASEKYEKCGFLEKALLANYNAFIGGLNRESESKNSERPLADKLSEIQQLMIQAELQNNKRMLGLLLRQRSYELKDAGKVHAAFLDGKRAVEFLELFGPGSDYHLALINAVDCALDLNDQFMAKAYYEQIISPLDIRVEYPMAYIKSRMTGQIMNCDPTLPVCVHYKQRLRKHLKSLTSLEGTPQDAAAKIIWAKSESCLKLSDGSRKRLYDKGFEAKLLSMLLKSSHKRSLLCEKLWPEYAESAQLDNRLHRLISRVNHKFNDIISYQNGSYQLSAEIEII